MALEGYITARLAMVEDDVREMVNYYSLFKFICFLSLGKCI